MLGAMKPKFRPPFLALALALLALAPALPAQGGPEAETLQGSWVLSEILDSAGLPIPLELLPSFTVMLTFEGQRFTLRYVNPETAETPDDLGGTFEAAAGILRLTPDENGEPENIAYTLEDGVLTLHFMEDGIIFVTMIFRRE